MNPESSYKRIDAYLHKLAKGEKVYYEVDFFEEVLEHKLLDDKIDKRVVESILEHFQKIHHRHFSVCYYLVRYLWLTDKTKEAIEYSYAMINQYPDEIDGLEMAGFIFLGNNQYEESKHLFEQCLEYEKSIGEDTFLDGEVTNAMMYRFQIGRCAYFMGNHQEAIDQITKSLNFQNVAADIIEILYESYVETNQLKEGIDFLTLFYHRSASVDIARVLPAIARLYQKRGQTHKAIEFMELAEKYSLWGDGDQFFLAQLLEQGKRHEEAILLYRILDTEEENQADIRLAIARCYYFCSDFPMAYYWLGKSIEAGEPTIEFWYWSAQINSKLERYEDSFEDIQYYIELGGTHSKAWLSLVEMAVLSENTKALFKLIVKSELIKITQQIASKVVSVLFEVNEELVGLFIDRCAFKKELYHPVLLVHQCARLINENKQEEALKHLIKIIDYGDHVKRDLIKKYPSSCQVEWVQKMLTQNS